MVGMRMLKKPARSCVRFLRKMTEPKPPADLEDPQWTPFLCNVCGMSNYLPLRRLSREDGRCTKCGCYGRLRSMMYAVTAHFSPDEIILARMKPRKDIRGIGCSDWGYTKLLAEKFDYVNTFYDREPRLDLCNVDWSRWPPDSVDFITCTDVLEHVEPPVERTFENMRRLLKPGGVLILTVPTPGARHSRALSQSARLEDREGARPASRDQPPPRRHDRAIRQPLLPRRRRVYPGVSPFLAARSARQHRKAPAFAWRRSMRSRSRPTALPALRGNFVLVAEKTEVKP